MPSIVERRKATQRRALAKQRARIAKYRRERKALAGLRAAIRKAKTNILRRKLLIQPPKGVTITGNTATGGTERDRLVAVALAACKAHAEGRRKSFYSQAGRWTVDYAITGEPNGYRSDCSQWVTSVYKSAGLPDPNGTDYTWGNTRTLGSHGKLVSSPKPGDLGLYGSFPFHHVEMVVGLNPLRFAGHGSPPVDQVAPGLPDQYRSYVD
jgi:hypothetical protein